MTGRNDTKRVRLVLQERDRRLLKALDTFRVIDREQAAVIAPFHSTTRANTRLLQLTQAGLLQRLIVGTVHGGHRHLYARTRQGAAAVDQPHRVPPWKPFSPIVAGQPLLEHQLRLNALHIAFRELERRFAGFQLNRWETFVQPITSGSRLIPDAYTELLCGNTLGGFFIEVDLATEPLHTWREKARRYLALARSGTIADRIGRIQFGVLVVVPSVRRLTTLRSVVASITTKLFWFSTLETADPDKLLEPRWWRPLGDEPVELFS